MSNPLRFFDTNGDACYVPTTMATALHLRLELDFLLAVNVTMATLIINSRSRSGRNSNNRSRSGSNSAPSAPSDEEIQCKQANLCKVAQLAVANGHTTSRDGTNYSEFLSGIRSQPNVAQAVAQAQDNFPSNILSSIEALFPGASREGADKDKSSGASRKGATKPITKPEPFLAFPSGRVDLAKGPGEIKTPFKLSGLDWGDNDMDTFGASGWIPW